MILQSNSYCESIFSTIRKKFIKYIWKEVSMLWMGAIKVYPCSSKIYNKQKPSGQGKRQKQAAANEYPEDWTFIITFINSLTSSKYCVIIVFIIYFRSQMIVQYDFQSLLQTTYYFLYSFCFQLRNAYV